MKDFRITVPSDKLVSLEISENFHNYWLGKTD